jgi:leucyl-tRNA synthetase
LDGLAEYAIPRLAAATGGAIDDDEPRRRKLAFWCDTARRRISENMAALQTHRATRNTMILLDRIKAFEQRSAATDPGNAADVAATASALALLVRLAEPLAPQAMSAIWERAGHEGALSDLPWPG